MAQLSVVFYLMGLLLWGGWYKSQLIIESDKSKNRYESLIIAESMVISINSLKRFAEENPGLTNQKVQYSQLSLPSWFRSHHNIELAVNSGEAFVYCSNACPPDLLTTLSNITHNSPFTGKAKGGKLKSKTLIDLEKSIPSTIPEGAVVYFY